MTLEQVSETRHTLWADATVLGVAIVWGASYPVAKTALVYAPVLLLIFYRFSIAAMVMAATARKNLFAASRRDLAAGALLGGTLFLIFAAETYGVQFTSATNTALIISLSTILTPILEFGLQRRVPPAGVLVGAVVAVMGIGVLAGGLTALNGGDLLVLAAAGLRAIMVVSTKRLMTGRALSSSALTAVQAVTVAALSLMLLQAQPQTGLLVTAGPEFWAAVAFLSLFCTIGAFYVQNAAVRRTNATRVSFLLGTEPLFGFAFAWLFLSEPATPLTLLGAGLIVSGTFLGLLFERDR